jgi:hypothetical protein
MGIFGSPDSFPVRDHCYTPGMTLRNFAPLTSAPTEKTPKPQAFPGVANIILSFSPEKAREVLASSEYFF